MITTIFFDLDDTLHNSTRLARLARNAAVHIMVDKGLPLTFDRGCNILASIIKEKGSNYPRHFDMLVEQTMNKKDYKIISAGVIGYHNTKFANMHPFSDTISTLIKLKQMQMQLNIITNGRAIKQWEKVLRLGLESFFDNIIISEIIGHNKPEPEIYKKSLDISNCTAEEALFVDNDPECIMGAKKCGMHTILMNKLQKEEPTIYCDHVITSLSQIPAIINNL